VFVATNTRGQRETSGQLGDFCLKCRAPLAVQKGKIASPTQDLTALRNTSRSGRPRSAPRRSARSRARARRFVI
jgi:hypothetical protein